jgi:hypothetical protein
VQLAGRRAEAYARAGRRGADRTPLRNEVENGEGARWLARDAQQIAHRIILIERCLAGRIIDHRTQAPEVSVDVRHVSSVYGTDTKHRAGEMRKREGTDEQDRQACENLL